MKWALGIAILSILGACATPHKTMPTLSVSMIVLNHGQPFVSERLAVRLARVVIEEKYPNDIFVASELGVVENEGDTWSVTFENALIGKDDKNFMPMLGDKIAPRRLVISIRKTNAEVVSIS